MEGMELGIFFHLRRVFSYDNGEHPIILRVAYLGKRKDIVTGLSCRNEEWDPENSCVRTEYSKAFSINEELVLIKAKTRQRFQELKERGKPFTPEELVLRIKGKELPPQTLMEYMDLKLKELEDSVEIDMQLTTFYKYRRVKRYLEEFLLSERGLKNCAVSSVDEQFINRFYNFIRKQTGNGQNSASSLMSVLRTILKMAIETGVIQKNPFTSMHFRRKQVNREYLTMEEIEKLEQLQDLSAHHELARDLFLFACYTGISYSDIRELKKGHFIFDNDGTTFINKARLKTDIMSLVPLLPAAERILLKYSPDQDCRNFKWKVPYNTKLNKMLKEIATLAGIDRNLFMHLGRHTFATTITLSNGVSLESVSKMLGHSTIKHTQVYAKITGAKVKNEMSRLMGLYK